MFLHWRQFGNSDGSSTEKFSQVAGGLNAWTRSLPMVAVAADSVPFDHASHCSDVLRFLLSSMTSIPIKPIQPSRAYEHY